MTDEQKYTELLKELAELLKSKNNTIAFQQYQIEALQEKLTAAEDEINRMKGKKNK